jgi:hypothetical protein
MLILSKNFPYSILHGVGLAKIWGWQKSGLFWKGMFGNGPKGFRII